MIIGVDFDNTLVTYDEVMHRAALERGLIRPETQKNKKDIRDEIRMTLDGEDAWTRLQAEVYGPRMAEAQLIPGVLGFFDLCRRNRVPTFIVSHKTEYAKFDKTGTNLRDAALEWMKRNGFFDEGGIGLNMHDVYFGSTRAEKIRHIIDLGCTHFIDDLEEVFEDAAFPVNVEKILFQPASQSSVTSDYHIFQDWRGICEYIFSK